MLSVHRFAVSDLSLATSLWARGTCDETLRCRLHLPRPGGSKLADRIIRCFFMNIYYSFLYILYYFSLKRSTDRTFARGCNTMQIRSQSCFIDGKNVLKFLHFRHILFIPEGSVFSSPNQRSHMQISMVRWNTYPFS